MKLPLHGLALLSTIGVAAVSACSSSNAGGPQVSPKQAQDDFVATFTRGAYDQVDAQLAALDAAYQQNPNDPRTTVLLGLANLWGVAEGARVNLSGARQGQLALDGLHYLDLAAQLNPDDARIPGWIGTVSVRIATATNDARLLQDGIASVDQGMSRFPAFNGFPEMIVHSLSDATSPDYDKGLESGWAVMGACAGTTIDRTDPDFSPYMSRWTSTGDLRVCFNPPTAVHNFEGFNLQMGDMQVKKGNVDLAKIFYANAKLSPTYASWPYKNEIEQRLSTDLNAMSAAFQSADPSARPVIPSQGAHACTFCHQG